MQKEISKIDFQLLEQAVIEAIWIQWRSLGSFIETDRLAHTMIDPDALLLTSLTLRHYDKRLWDVVASWAKNGSKLISLQRVNNLVEKYPALTKNRLAEFAHIAKLEGKDFRWQTIVGADSGPVVRKHELWKAYPNFWYPSALVLRMRLGIGVGLVSDLLSFLISMRGEWASAKLIAQAIEYSVYSIRRVAHDMASAQLIESTQGKPVQYRIKAEAWYELLDITNEVPSWRFWFQVYAFAVKVINLKESGEWENLSSYLLSTKLRDMVEAHQDAFILNHIDLPDPGKYVGEEYLPAFKETIIKLTEWIKKEI